jgi:hypothetical protein
MARFGKFMKEQLMPEDPMDWIILFLVMGIVFGGAVLVFVMYSSGLI